MKLFKRILGFSMALTLILALAGCGEKTDSPETVVTNYIAALQAGDTDAAEKYIQEDAEEPLDQADEKVDDVVEENPMDTITQTVEFEILSTEENGDNATVKTKIKNIDMKPVMGDYLAEMFGLAFSGLDEETMEAKGIEILQKSIEAHKDELAEAEVAIALVKEEASWVIVPDEAFADALTGGLLTVSNDINNAFDTSDDAA